MANSCTKWRKFPSNCSPLGRLGRSCRTPGHIEPQTACELSYTDGIWSCLSSKAGPRHFSPMPSAPWEFRLVHASDLRWPPTPIKRCLARDVHAARYSPRGVLNPVASAEARGRTGTPVKAADFESAASAYSATSAMKRAQHTQEFEAVIGEFGKPIGVGQSAPHWRGPASDR